MTTMSMYIILASIIAVVVLAIAWIYRDRLTEGFFKVFRGSIEAGLRAWPPESEAQPPQTVVKGGVSIKGSFSESKVEDIAGRDIAKGSAEASRSGVSPGVSIEGEFSDSQLKKIAGRDIIEEMEE